MDTEALFRLLGFNLAHQHAWVLSESGRDDVSKGVRIGMRLAFKVSIRTAIHCVNWSEPRHRIALARGIKEGITHNRKLGVFKGKAKA